MQKDFLSAVEAAASLGVSIQTLYAYVSRGLIRSETADRKRRTKKYYQADVEALRQKKALRKNPTQAAERALDWGQPVLESAITHIQNGRLEYRGHDASALARSASFETVVNLLWQEAGHQPITYPQRLQLPELFKAIDTDLPLRNIDKFQILLPLYAARDLAGFDLSTTAVIQTGQKILSFMLKIVVGEDKPIESAAQTLRQAWLPDQPEIESLINMALILCADHELNVSAFTVRTVASAKSTPYAAVNAGLSALQGTLHGGHTERVVALMGEIGTPERVDSTLASRLRRGEPIPGFHHPLYPNGDPRATLLFAAMAPHFSGTDPFKIAQHLIQAVDQSIQLKPTIDLALTTLTLSAKFPTDAALTLFAIGRTAGWLGHIMEQYQQDQLIRPRAKYVGR